MGVDCQGRELGGDMSPTLRFRHLLGVGGRGIRKTTVLSSRITEIQRNPERIDSV